MSGKGGQERLNLRHQAVGMILGGKSSREVAKALKVNQSSVVRWFQKHNSGEDLSDRKRSGRPTVMSKISKMVVSKSLTKKRQSTRKLAERLTRHGHAMSHTTVYNYLTQKLGVRSFKRCKIPKLTEEHVRKRLRFCRERLNWTVEDWKKIIWSDESPYLLYPDGNSKNDVIWAREKQEVFSQGYDLGRNDGHLLVRATHSPPEYHHQCPVLPGEHPGGEPSAYDKPCGLHRTFKKVSKDKV
jgi:transposase